MLPLPNRSRAFERALVLASVVPFLLTIANNWTQQTGSPVLLLAGLVSLLVVLNMLHVPSTLYLYTDPEIRARTKAEPWRMAVIPLLLWFGSAAAYFWASSHASPMHSTALLLMVVFFLHWQAWHFGMQSYGVLSFVSITSRRPKREKWQAKLERGLVMWGTIFGMMAVYVHLGRGVWFMTMPEVDYGFYDRIFSVVFAIGRAGCYAAAAIALAYLLRYRSLFTFNSALIFMISVCFFLPDYLPFLPKPALSGGIASLLNFTLVHGMQYLVFMAAHAVGRSRALKEKNAALPAGQKKFGTLDPYVMLFMIVVVIGLFINDAGKLSWFAGGLLHMSQIEFPADRLLVTFTGFAFGLTMAHFWVDQYIWKLSQPGPRAWVADRYGYVMPPKPTA